MLLRNKDEHKILQNYLVDTSTLRSKYQGKIDCTIDRAYSASATSKIYNNFLIGIYK